MRVDKTASGSYAFNQEEAIVELLREHGLSDANTTRSPIGIDVYEVQDANSKLLDNNNAGKHAKIRSFQSLVGSLLWITRCTRLDVSCCFMYCKRHVRYTDGRVLQRTRPEHDRRTNRVCTNGIAKETIAMKIEMVPERDAGDAPTLESFSDADFAADKQDRKSITGGVVRLNDMVVSWCAKKQGGVTLSTMEAEFLAASEVERELLGIRETLREIGMEPEPPMTMRIDNQAAICRSTAKRHQLKRNTSTSD
ncbi:unnamed protein product [Peronospora farinosa]|nr:unnamed protein product [Peronospora farinosa]